jgi:hypothetical protein
VVDVAAQGHEEVAGGALGGGVVHDRGRCIDRVQVRDGHAALASRGAPVLPGKESAGAVANTGAMTETALQMPDDDVVDWRRRRLVRAGFAEALAEDVARDCAMDLHALLELVDRHCPPALAVRIVAPLDGECRPCSPAEEARRARTARDGRRPSC